MPHSGDTKPERHIRRSARGPDRHAHLCWWYRDPAEFLVRAKEFLAEGLALGQRVRYLGPAGPDALAAALGEVDGMAAALDGGAVEVASPEPGSPSDPVVDPAGQVAAYAEATEEALAAGYTGLRVAADHTALARTPAQVAALLRHEHLVDRYSVDRPFAAMCAYDITRLGDDTVAQLTAVHPDTNRPGQFRLHAAQVPGAAVQLGGELDLGCHDLLEALLAQLDPQPGGGEFVVYAPELTFIDHHGLLALADHARQRGATAVLRTACTGAARVVSALELPNVRVESIT
ncbi:hypothetical protein FHS29_007313 [Saccharothrix tamanrassetensis]|uniref:MEDS domain-containing protein n=1 Tax=Saccharothrix tamanrassetensis TaxID=1051531 RepID=A0A841CXL9_9PSEU|nr:MEDS domain-containing protein [Saccharothrix tamanrassetensis]MBB5960685.1 hypothetical protein [Saccharothrix tamanrassetensis]